MLREALILIRQRSSSSILSLRLENFDSFLPSFFRQLFGVF
jgi:hypothetical protein